MQSASPRKPPSRSWVATPPPPPPLRHHAVGFSEEAAIAQLGGDLDVYISKFRPMKYTLSGRDEKTLMKLIVHAETDRVVGCHMWV